MMALRGRKKAKGRKKQSPEEKRIKRIQREHAKLVRSAFRNAGFQTVQNISDREFSFQGITSDFDDIFIYENIIVAAEYTISQESGVGDHLKKKKILFDKVHNNSFSFISFLSDKFTTFRNSLDKKYHQNQLKFIIIYCSLHNVKKSIKDQIDTVIFYDYNIAKYFEAVTKTVRDSARFEIFDFLGIDYNEVGLNAISAKANQTEAYDGSILPEAHSNFGEGFKVVSFYIDPKSLLERAYVLRKYGWKTGSSVYQRMIERPKISSLRKYLRDEKRVFVNNIIATLPDDTKLIDANGNTINPNELTKTQPGKIQLPLRYNTIGIVDGQHRVFSYHEGGIFDDEIERLRLQQNLLVTGIVFPPHTSETERLKFEATLFLEINSNQKNAKSDLKQEINIVINPFAAESIAKRVLNYMNDMPGPLQDEFERFFFEKDKLKTTSVVSFAIKPLVAPKSDQSLFALWDQPEKAEVINGSSDNMLEEYVEFCAKEINHIFSAVKSKLPTLRWTADRKFQGRFLTTTNVNGIISCLRCITADRKHFSVIEYMSKFEKIDDFPFDIYKTSHYQKMGKDLYNKYFI